METKAFLSKSWKHQITGIEGDVILFGVNIFDYSWIDTGKKAKITEPLYQQKFEFSVYKVNIDGTEYEFSAGEFSNLVWGFYLYEF